MDKTLDRKLHRLQENPTCKEFILADAKDADMAFGLASPGHCSQTDRQRTLLEYRQTIRDVVGQGLIDICLMSASTSEVLAIDEQLFVESPVTPAIRANDSTDIWLAGGSGNYSEQLSLPFRSADVRRAMQAVGTTRDPAVKLGLYSITLNNDVESDVLTLSAYSAFRREAAELSFDYFLEVFPPNATGEQRPKDLGRFVADSVARTLAGLTREERPRFLKIPYLGPDLTEQLAAYDPSVVLGIMGGSAGTTYDSFALLEEARKYGVRAALFGRRINNAEDQLAFVQHLRWIADGETTAQDAVRSYHSELEKLHLQPRRPLGEDLERSSTGLAHY